MIVPVQNIVETVDLSGKDALLPLFECIINSILSLKQIEKSDGEIQIKLTRGDNPIQPSLDNLKTISSVKVTDNGIGFTMANYQSFQTPFSKTHIEFGCKGIGRFTMLAAFKKIHVRSNYFENGKYYYREFMCDAENEITEIDFKESNKHSLIS